MVYILIFIGIAMALGFLIMSTARFVLRVFYKEKPKVKSSNPYIDYHKVKMINDKNYEDYLEWLQKSGEGVPIEKIEAPEDIEANKKINNLLRKV